MSRRTAAAVSACFKCSIQPARVFSRARRRSTSSSCDTWKRRPHARGHALCGIKTAIDIRYEVRSVLGSFLRFGGLNRESHRKLIEHYYPRLKRAALGPPLSNIETLLALQRAGLPDFSVYGPTDTFSIMRRSVFTTGASRISFRNCEVPGLSTARSNSTATVRRLGKRVLGSAPSRHLTSASVKDFLRVARTRPATCQPLVNGYAGCYSINCYAQRNPSFASDQLVNFFVAKMRSRVLVAAGKFSCNGS